MYDSYLEAAFANMRMWQAAGMIIGCLASNYMCSKYSIILFLVLSVVSVTLNAALEIHIKLQEEQEKAEKARCYRLPERATWLPSLNPHQKGERSQLCEKLPKSTK